MKIANSYYIFIGCMLISITIKIVTTSNGKDTDSSEVEVIDLLEITTKSSPKEPQFQFDGSDGVEDSNGDFVGVRIRVLEFPGQPVRIYGKRVNYSDAFGDEISVSEFKGIPFAEAPLNSLRFQRPVLKLPSNGFRALRETEPCPQLSNSGVVIGEEDCLYMNVFVPGEKKDEESKPGGKLPVLVWFHGESPSRFRARKFSALSSGSAKDLHPFVFLQNKIIVVTPQYRLGSFGYLSVSNEDLNGNMGSFDQLLALEWVQKFISYFGGDSSQVTILGHGSSATVTGLLATSDMARGLFHRMILMSGSPLSPFAVDTNQKLTFAEIALQNSCPSFPTLQFVRCMQKRQVDGIILADGNLTKGRHIGKFRSPLAVIQKEDDGRFLPPLIDKDPMLKLLQGRFETVPIIIGVTRSEMSGFLSSLAGMPYSVLSSTVFSSPTVLKQFIRAILSRSAFGLDSDLVAQLATFEYFSGLNISERQEQAQDLVEEMLSDYLFYMPALSLAKVWSRFAPVHLYLFDYVATGLENDSTENNNTFGRLETLRKRRQDDEDPADIPITQAIHGSDLLFLMEGYKGSAQDRDVANVMVDHFINFIHKGSPLQSGLEWPQYREDTKEYLQLSDSIQTKSGFRQRQEQFWTELLKEVSQKSCTRTTKGRSGLGATSLSKNYNGYQENGGGSLSSEAQLNYFPIKRNAESHKKRMVNGKEPPLIFEDVSATDISQKFFTFDWNILKSNGSFY